MNDKEVMVRRSQR